MKDIIKITIGLILFLPAALLDGIRFIFGGWTQYDKAPCLDMVYNKFLAP